MIRRASGLLVPRRKLLAGLGGALAAPAIIGRAAAQMVPFTAALRNPVSCVTYASEDFSHYTIGENGTALVTDLTSHGWYGAAFGSNSNISIIPGITGSGKALDLYAYTNEYAAGTFNAGGSLSSAAITWNMSFDVTPYGGLMGHDPPAIVITNPTGSQNQCSLNLDQINGISFWSGWWSAGGSRLNGYSDFGSTAFTNTQIKLVLTIGNPGTYAVYLNGSPSPIMSGSGNTDYWGLGNFQSVCFYTGNPGPNANMCIQNIVVSSC